MHGEPDTKLKFKRLSCHPGLHQTEAADEEALNRAIASVRFD